MKNYKAIVNTSKATDRKKALYLMVLEQVIMEKLTDPYHAIVQFINGVIRVDSDNELLITRLRALWNRVEELDD